MLLKPHVGHVIVALLHLMTQTHVDELPPVVETIIETFEEEMIPIAEQLVAQLVSALATLSRLPIANLASSDSNSRASRAHRRRRRPWRRKRRHYNDGLDEQPSDDPLPHRRSSGCCRESRADGSQPHFARIQRVRRRFVSYNIWLVYSFAL